MEARKSFGSVSRRRRQLVRKVHVEYKNPKPGEPANMYNGRGYNTVERSVNRLVLLLPVDEKEQQSY